MADCSLLRLLVSFPALRERQAIESIESRVFEEAVDLCRSVWYYSGFPALANAALTSTILGLAEAVFEDLGPWAASELYWARNCRQATRRRIGRLGSEEGRSLISGILYSWLYSEPVSLMNAIEYRKAMTILFRVLHSGHEGR